MLDSLCFEDEWFDVAVGLYWYCVDYHDGMSSTLYRIQCELGYRPSPFESDPGTDGLAFDVYEALADGSLDPSETLAYVNAAYADSDR